MKNRCEFGDIKNGRMSIEGLEVIQLCKFWDKKVCGDNPTDMEKIAGVVCRQHAQCEDGSYNYYVFALNVHGTSDKLGKYRNVVFASEKAAKDAVVDYFDDVNNKKKEHLCIQLGAITALVALLIDMFIGVANLF